MNDVIYYDITNVNDIIDEAFTISMFSPNKFIITNSKFIRKKKHI